MSSLEILDNIRKTIFYIGETLVEESKHHISQEQALDKIREYLNQAHISSKDFEQLKCDLEVKDENI